MFQKNEKKMYTYWQLTRQNVFGCAVFFSYSVGQFLLKGQTMRVYTRRHVFLGRSPHPRKTCADTLSSCLSRHTWTVRVRTPTVFSGCSHCLNGGIIFDRLPSCSYEALLSAYTIKFNDPIYKCDDGSTTAEADLWIKLGGATSLSQAQAYVKANICPKAFKSRPSLDPKGSECRAITSRLAPRLSKHFRMD